MGQGNKTPRMLDSTTFSKTSTHGYKCHIYYKAFTSLILSQCELTHIWILNILPLVLLLHYHAPHSYLHRRSSPRQPGMLRHLTTLPKILLMQMSCHNRRTNHRFLYHYYTTNNIYLLIFVFNSNKLVNSDTAWPKTIYVVTSHTSDTTIVSICNSY